MNFIKKMIGNFLNLSSPQEHLKKALHISNTKKKQAVFIFDIDSTLLCMKFRTQAILEDLAREEFILKNFPKYSKKMAQILVTTRDWSVLEILSHYNIKDEKLLQETNKYWRKHFFSNQYLHLDKPYPKAVDFVNKLSKSMIYYLTARNSHRLREGTLKSLRTWGFPIQKESQLIMKEDNQESDKDYKNKHLKILAQKFETLCFFENEPVILNQASQSFPHIHLFWIDSTHSRRAKPTRKALKISMDYSLD